MTLPAETIPSPLETFRVKLARTSEDLATGNRHKAMVDGGFVVATVAASVTLEAAALPEDLPANVLAAACAIGGIVAAFSMAHSGWQHLQQAKQYGTESAELLNMPRQ